MRIRDTEPTTYSHAYNEHSHRDSDTLSTWALLTGLSCLVAWIFLGPPYEFLSTASSTFSSPFDQDELLSGAAAADIVPITVSTATRVLLDLTALLILLSAYSEFRRYKRWRHEPLSIQTLHELASCTDSLDFESHPACQFDPPLERMTNGDLADWCETINTIHECELSEKVIPIETVNERNERHTLIRYMNDRTTGEVPPRPFVWRKRMWPLPRAYEPAKQGRDGWYWDHT